MSCLPRHVIESVEALIDGRPLSAHDSAKLRAWINPAAGVDQRAALAECERRFRSIASDMPGTNASEKARRIRRRLVAYFEGKWRRDRSLEHAPLRDADLWQILRLRENVPSARTFARIFAKPGCVGKDRSA